MFCCSFGESESFTNHKTAQCVHNYVIAHNDVISIMLHDGQTIHMISSFATHKKSHKPWSIADNPGVTATYTLYILNHGWLLASNARPIPIVSYTNKLVKGGWLVHPSHPLVSAPVVYCNQWWVSRVVRTNITSATQSLLNKPSLFCPLGAGQKVKKAEVSANVTTLVSIINGYKI